MHRFVPVCLIIVLFSCQGVFAATSITAVSFFAGTSEWGNGNDGIVQVTVYNSVTKTYTTGVICNAGITNLIAAVLCYEMGFVNKGTVTLSSRTNLVTTSVLVKDIQCTAIDQTNPATYVLSRCSFTTPSTSCTNAQSLAVQCGATRAGPTTTTVAPNVATLPPVNCTAGSSLVRLVNGTATGGRVEINYNGTWGTICNLGFYQNAAKVICKMACMSSTYARAVTGNYVSSNSTILISDLTCPANANTTNDCTHSGWGSPSSVCTHYMDARVECGPPTTMTPTVPNPTVTCSAASATVSFNKTNNKDITTANMLQLQNITTYSAASCAYTVTINTTSIIVTFKFTQCGGKATFNSTSTIYTNNILRVFKVVSGIISSVNYTIPVVCVVPKSNTGNGGNISPQVVTVKPQTGVDSLTLSLKLYKDAAFTTEIAVGSTITLGTLIHLRIAEMNKLVNMQMSVRNCWATAGSARTSTPRVDLIVNACPVSSSNVTVSPLRSIDAMTQSFSFTAIVFSTAKLYVHCDTVTCYNKDTTANCLRACVPSGRRKKRSASIQEQLEKLLAQISQKYKEVNKGPYYVTDGPIGAGSYIVPSTVLMSLSAVLLML